jgi:hypothetical protein
MIRKRAPCVNLVGSTNRGRLRTKLLSGLSYTALAYLVDKDGNPAQNPLESRQVVFTWTESPVVSVPMTSGTS